MLGKLMKYELKATARWFLPLYAAVLVLAVINRLLFTDPMILESNGFSFRQMMTGLSMFVYAILLIGAMAVTLVVCVIRFYKSLLGDEGYLMFTLPVKTHAHIFSKLLIAMLWNVASAGIAIASILIMVPAPDWAGFREGLAEFHLLFGATGYFTLTFTAIVSLVYGILEIYAAITLGHLFNKHKLLASFGMYIAINAVAQFVVMLAMPTLVKAMFTFEGDIARVAPAFNSAMLITGAITLVLAAGCYVLTNTLLQKKLNLE